MDDWRQVLLNVANLDEEDAYAWRYAAGRFEL